MISCDVSLDCTRAYGHTVYLADSLQRKALTRHTLVHVG